MHRLLFVLLFVFSHVSMGEILLIAHKDMPVEKLSKKSIQDIYLGNQQVVNNLRIIPLDQDHDSPTRAEFYDKIIDLPHNQIISHWSRLIFTGKGQAPISLSGNNSIIEFVRHNPNVIGYIDEKYLSSDVKILFRTK